MPSTYSHQLNVSIEKGHLIDEFRHAHVVHLEIHLNNLVIGMRLWRVKVSLRHIFLTCNERAASGSLITSGRYQRTQPR